MKDERPTQFKHAINETVVQLYVTTLSEGGWDAAAFEAAVLGALPDLELKARVKHISDCLYRAFRQDFPRGIAQLLPMLDQHVPSEASAVDFAHWPIAQFVEDYGVDHPDLSIPAMKAITRHFSCEFALRPFLVRYPDRMLEVMHAWAEDPDVHVRRTASEGMRPRLPWGMRLNDFVDDPQPVLGVLAKLRCDTEPYVRRSVANCLNDITKDHPDTAMDVIAAWDETPDANTLWIKKRALRTLVKAGHPRALALLGFGPPEFQIDDLRLDAEHYTVGDSMTLSFVVVNTADHEQAFMIDYRVHFMKANGSRTAKVFKLTTLTLGPGEHYAVERRQHLKPISTRRYHAGVHAVDVQVNGEASHQVTFTLALAD